MNLNEAKEVLEQNGYICEDIEQVKYKLTDETMSYYGHTLHRIVCVNSFNNVKAGEKGGWIESEKNLSQKGNCWIYDDGIVCDKAMVYGNAIVYDKARVIDETEVYQNAKVYGNAELYGAAKVHDNAQVFDDVVLGGYAEVYKEAKVGGNIRIDGEDVYIR